MENNAQDLKEYLSAFGQVPRVPVERLKLVIQKRWALLDSQNAELR